MTRHVRGILFADYVRMIRGTKGIEWAKLLDAEDRAYLSLRIEPDAWYPMPTFERLGNAILKAIAGGEVDAARMWGRISVDQLRAKTPSLVADGDPLDTLMRFRVLRATFFDFEALEVRSASPGHAKIAIRYHMGATAEEAASFQTMGFFERLLVVAGAKAIDARFEATTWTGSPHTLLALTWEDG